MDRRRGLRCAVGVIVGTAASSAVFAQPAGRLPRIGTLSFGTTPSGSAPDPAGGYSTGLSELGHAEGRSIVVERRYADGQPERLAALAAELVQLKVDAILVGRPAAREAAAAKGLGAELIVMEISGADDLEPALAAGLKTGMRAVMQLSSPVISALSKQSAAFVAQQRLPGISAFRGFAAQGGLLSYGPVRVDMYRRAASYVDKILKGARPGELAIEQPARFELVVNLKTANVLDLTIPQSLLLRADEVIQ